MKRQNTHPPLKRWLTIADVAEEYGFKSHTQKRMRHLKLIPFSKIGKQVRYDRLELDKLLEDNKVV